MATFRVNKTQSFTVMSNHHLKDRTLSIRAKGLLSQMLSLPDDWDYSLRGLAKINNDGITAITSTVNELEEHGYIVRTRERDEMGRLRGMIYDIFEFPQTESAEEKWVTPNPENPETKPFSPKSGFPILGKPSLGEPILGKPILGKPTQSSTYILNNNNKYNKKSNPIESISEKTDFEADEEESRLLMEERICDNIQYEILTEEYDKDEVDELVDLMVDTVCTNRETMRVAKDEIPVKDVRARIMMLNHEHICYVLDCLRSNTTKVKNIKAYLLTALYNAPVTMQSYYRAAVNHNFYGDSG